MCFRPEPGDLRLHKDTESLSLGDEVETGSTIIQQKTCSYVSPLPDVILRRRGRKNSAVPGMYSLLDYFTQQILRRRSGIPVRLQLMQTLAPAPLPLPTQLGMESPFFSIYYTYSAFWMLPSVFHN